MVHCKRIPVIRITAKERAYRNKRIRCDFSIVSQTVLPEQITQELGIQPNRSYRKGDYKMEGRDTIYTYPSHLWEISSVEAIHNEKNIQLHIDYVKKELENKFDILDRYKQDPRYESIISIRDETETGSVGIDLNIDDLTFIRSICNRFSCFLMSTSKTGSDD